MAVSAAEYYEVRWRVKGNNEAWSSPRRVSPVSEVVIEELDRNTLYEFEVRAVSNCGAKSIWVPSDYTVPGAVPPTSVDTLTAQSLADGVHLGWTSIATPAAGIESSIERSADGVTGWAERARVRSTAYTDPETSGTTYYYRVRYVNFAGQYGAYSPVVSSAGVNVGSIGTNASNALADAAAAQADATNSLATLADIASDNILSPVEKPVVIRDTNVITTEQAGIDAQATAYSITTEKTAYDTAVSALTSYLATLTTPVLWSDLSGNTAIVGATFRSKFADVYTTRQALLNAIYAAAKAKADAAQSTGNTALANAASAQSAANAAQTDATNSLATLADIASDSKLTANEKVKAKQEYLEVTGEQAGIDAQATAYAITTEKTNYDSAITALKNYLKTTVGVLDASYNWTGITGTTAITRTTWDSNWTAVYTTRQALLNAIYAAAKTKADAAQGAADNAQGTANTAVGQVTQLPVINGGFDIAPTGYGWAADSGTWSVDTTSISPGVQPNCARRNGNSTTPNDVYRNAGLTPVYPGQVVKSQALIKAVGANGVCQVRISWRDATNAELSVTYGNTVTGTTTAGSYVVGAAPTGAVFAKTELVAAAHTTGYYLVDNVVCTQYPTNIDEVPDGTTNARTLATRVNAGNPLIDFSAGYHLNKNIDNLADGSTYARVKASQVVDGAVKLLGSGRNAISNPNFTQNIGGYGYSQSTIGGYIRDGWSLIELDDPNVLPLYDAGGPGIGFTFKNGVSVPAGGQVTSVWQSDSFAVQPSANYALRILRQIFLAQALPAGLNAVSSVAVQFYDASGAAIPGTTYYEKSGAFGNTYDVHTGAAPSNAASAKLQLFGVLRNSTGAAVVTTNVNTAEPLFVSVEFVQAADLDHDVTDGTTFGRPIQTRLSSGAPLIDFAAGIHLNKNADNIGDGTTYGRLKMASMTGNDFDFSKGGVNRTLDYMGDTATYARVSTTDLSGNRIGLRVAGSGQVLGNQLNAPNSLTLNYGAARTTTAVTATPAGAVSINAFSVNMGGNTISYNAVSNAVTGLTQGTTYQIYCHDLGGTGGTKTWYAIAGTANAALQQGDDVVLGGQVTIPTSGSSGGGGGGFCVTADMFVADGELAGEPVPGALYDCMDIPTRGMSKFQRPLYGMEISSQPCVRIVTVDGAELDCSASTPFNLLDGRAARAADMKGETVVTDLGVEVVASVTPIGIRSVCHRHHGGCSFAAGANPKHRIYSHNALKP